LRAMFLQSKNRPRPPSRQHRPKRPARGNPTLSVRKERTHLRAFCEGFELRAMFLQSKNRPRPLFLVSLLKRESWP
jgi:hypothetical protein